MAHPKRARRPTSEVVTLILAAAEQVFTEKGYVAATTDEIATRAGVARSVVYRHFKNKADIFRSAVLLPFVEFLRRYQSAWRSQTTVPWADEQLMRTMVGLFYDSFETHRDTILTIALAGNDIDDDTNTYLDDELDRFFQTMLMISENEVHRRPWMSMEGLELTLRLTLGGIAASVALARLFLPRGERKPSRDELVDHITKHTLWGMRMREPAHTDRDS
jgi:AcrR family transcriptional regulator